MASRPGFAPFQAGRLRETIAIRRFQSTPTGRGGQTREWVTVPGLEAVPAEIVGLGGREELIAQTMQGIGSYRLTIRWREGIRANDQVLWTSNGNMELNITAPPQDPTGRRHFLQIFADTSSPQNAGV